MKIVRLYNAEQFFKNKKQTLRIKVHSEIVEKKNISSLLYVHLKCITFVLISHWVHLILGTMSFILIGINAIEINCRTLKYVQLVHDV